MPEGPAALPDFILARTLATISLVIGGGGPSTGGASGKCTLIPWELNVQKALVVLYPGLHPLRVIKAKFTLVVPDRHFTQMSWFWRRICFAMRWISGPLWSTLAYTVSAASCFASQTTRFACFLAVSYAALAAMRASPYTFCFLRRLQTLKHLRFSFTASSTFISHHQVSLFHWWSSCNHKPPQQHY